MTSPAQSYAERCAITCDQCRAAVSEANNVRCGDGTTQTLCSDCWNAGVRRRKAERKAQLAAEPRCEADGCRARGRWTIGGHTRLCGRHLTRAKANRVRAAGPHAIIMWLEQAWTDRESILRFANEKT